MAQKTHPRAQPTCDDTQALNRPARSSGMRTVSKTAPSTDASESFMNGSSALQTSARTSSPGTSCCAAASMTVRRTPCSGVPPFHRPRCTAETILRASGKVAPRSRASASGIRACRASMPARYHATC